ncbi:MAG: HAMP domain-containing sensor histidine kinase [Vagococcus sp.]|uniref:sensor histidine kinase n=2 Tax=Vagococcus sp. TaxID=1933889 RepID=UPI002FC83C5C
MATKWKNRLLFVLATFLCLGGWFMTYISSDRVSTADSTNYGLDFLMVESIYVNETIKDYEKNRLKDISQEEVENYRNRYGDLGAQVLDIKNQYEEKIVTTTDEKEQAKLKKERDSKIQAIVENFSDDEVVKKKIIEEEKEYLKRHKKQILTDSSNYISQANESFQYYFKDAQTGEIYTNVSELTKYSSDKEIKNALKENGYGKINREEYPIGFHQLITSEASEKGLFQSTMAFLKGYSIVSKDSNLATQLKEQDQSREVFSQLIYVGIIAMLVGIVVLYLYINTDFILLKLKKLPIDIAIIIFLILGFFAAFSAVVVHPYNMSVTSNLYNIILPFVGGLFCLGISFLAFKVIWQKLMPKYREKEIKEVFGDSFVCIVYNGIFRTYRKLPWRLKIVTIILLLISNVFLVMLFLRGYLGSLYQLILAVGLLILLGIEIKLFRDVLFKTKRALEQSKKLLASYDEDVSEELSLDEMIRELGELEKLIEVSQKDTIQSEMLKAELLTNVSHDLRTPLTSIITYGELLKQDSLSDENRKEYIEIINKKSQRMKHLIDDLFEVTKMNNGEIILDKTEVNLTQLLQQSVSEYSEEFEDHDLKVIFNKPEEEINISLDGERMWRVFDNIFGNAIKYAMPKTRVYLKLEKQEEMARIELKNISQHELNEDADQLMEKFQRGDSSRHTEGSGLGLAIINSIVSLHEGNIEIEVDGDLFKLNIYLPL